MNSKERVIRAVNHKDVDRIPCDFWAEDASLERIFQYVGHRDYERLLIDLNVDIRHIEAKMPSVIEENGIYQNFWGERYVLKDTPWGKMRDDLPGALYSAKSMDDLLSFNWPDPDSFNYSGIERSCDRYKDYAIMYGSADIWQRPTLVRGFENGLMDLALNPDWVHFLSEKYTQFYLKDYTSAQKAANGKIDIFVIISDLGTQQSQLMSVDMFNEFVAPNMKRLIDRIHELKAYALFHSCGMVHPFIERFIELGVDILDPIQPVNSKMMPENLVKEFGGRICFHGGIDVQNTLSKGTPDDVIHEVERYGSCFGKNGGYICCSTHYMQPDVPAENVLALYDTVNRLK